MKKTARILGDGIGGIISLILKTIGTIILIGMTTGAIFACIFVIYIKTNLIGSSALDVTLEEVKLNLSSTIYYKDSSTGQYKELVTLDNGQNRIWIDYEDIPKDFEHAVVAIEDKRFYKHNGVDWFRTSGAFVNMFLGMRNTFGGSTITQQLIKNVTLDNDTTVQRKLTEIFRALEFEKKYDKKDIIEWYLNYVTFGHNQNGIGAAAEYYFGKEVSELSLAEMASIVGITNNPSLYSPYISPENNKSRQELILDAMYDQGYITMEERDAAKAEELHFVPWTTSRTTGVEVYSYYIDTVIDDVISYFSESKGVSTTVASNMLYYGGYSIYACIDVDIQKKVDSIYQNLEEIPETTGSNQQLQSSIVIIDPYTGDIVALAGGVGEKTTARGLNWATSNLGRRPAGSSIKPVAIYAPAMDLGLITPDTTIEDAADIKLSGTDWFPYNDDHKNYGVVTLRYGVMRSLNTVAAQVLDMLTPQVSYNFLTSVLSFDLVEDDCNYAPLAMGQLTVGTNAREMASAYTIFPNSGVFTEGRTFSAIYDSNGTLVYNNIPESHPAISDTTAYWMNSILTDAVNGGTGTAAQISGMVVAGKTGTTSDNKDRWFVGYTPYYVAAVWTGYPTPEKISTSGNPAAKLWQKVMSLVHEDLPYKEFSTPANTYQSPVIGVGESMSYYIRGIAVSSDGAVEIIYEEEVGSRPAGRTVTVEALTVQDYDLTSPSAQVEFVISEDPADNIIEFTYVSNLPEPEPEEEPDPEEEEPGDDPGDEPEEGSEGNQGEEPNGDEPSNPTVPTVPDTPSSPEE